MTFTEKQRSVLHVINERNDSKRKRVLGVYCLVAQRAKLELRTQQHIFRQGEKYRATVARIVTNRLLRTPQ